MKAKYRVEVKRIGNWSPSGCHSKFEPGVVLRELYPNEAAAWKAGDKFAEARGWTKFEVTISKSVCRYVDHKLSHPSELKNIAEYANEVLGKNKEIDKKVNAILADEGIPHPCY